MHQHQQQQHNNNSSKQRNSIEAEEEVPLVVVNVKDMALTARTTWTILINENDSI